MEILKNFRDISLKKYILDLIHLHLTLGLAWVAALKIMEIVLELSTNMDMLLMTESKMRGGICHSILCNDKANNKYMKNQNKYKVSSYIVFLDKNDFCWFVMSITNRWI